LKYMRIESQRGHIALKEDYRNVTTDVARCRGYRLSL
jgi:hypothetical protein